MTCQSQGLTPVLDVTASSDDSGSELYLKAVNTSSDQAIRATVETENVTDELKRTAVINAVTAPTIEDSNSFAEPRRIAA